MDWMTFIFGIPLPVIIVLAVLFHRQAKRIKKLEGVVGSESSPILGLMNPTTGREHTNLATGLCKEIGDIAAGLSARIDNLEKRPDWDALELVRQDSTVNPDDLRNDIMGLRGSYLDHDSRLDALEKPKGLRYPLIASHCDKCSTILHRRTTDDPYIFCPHCGVKFEVEKVDWKPKPPEEPKIWTSNKKTKPMFDACTVKDCTATHNHAHGTNPKQHDLYVVIDVAAIVSPATPSGEKPMPGRDDKPKPIGATCRFVEVAGLKKGDHIVSVWQNQTDRAIVATGQIATGIEIDGVMRVSPSVPQDAHLMVSYSVGGDSHHSRTLEIDCKDQAFDNMADQGKPHG